METRDFPTTAIATLSSGVLIHEGGFGPCQEAAEFLMGHPIWTHHFASKTLWTEMQKAIAEQCPGMPTELPEVVKGDDSSIKKAVKDLLAEFGPTVKIRKGGGLTAMLPTDGIPDHLKNKTTIIRT